MPRATVAVLKTQPATVLRDYHELLNLADYQNVIDRYFNEEKMLHTRVVFNLPTCRKIKSNLIVFRFFRLNLNRFNRF